MSAAQPSAATESRMDRTAPPEKVCVRLSDIATALPLECLLRAIEDGEAVELPADHVFYHIVPTLSLQVLAGIRPDLIKPSDRIVQLPARRLAKTYALREAADNLCNPCGGLLWREDIPSPSSHLGKILTPPGPEELGQEASPPFAQEPRPTDVEPPPGRLAEIISNLPTFQRVTETTFLTLKPLQPEHGPLPARTQPDIPEQLALQTLFMTEESLTTDRVVELCGGLPGIQSCVLTSGSQVLASHNLPDGLDIVSLSSNASAMLQAMQDASAAMGIGDIPAVTLHTAKGPLSIFQKEQLAMLVFHGERGFIPGVREKMTTALAELARAPLALPASEAGD